MTNERHCSKCVHAREYLKQGETREGFVSTPAPMDVVFCDLRTIDGKPESLTAGHLRGRMICDMFERWTP
jgi:hypothetical protein